MQVDDESNEDVYSSRRNDGYTQLVEMGVRWYSPRLGRWTSPDSIIPGFANPQSFNRYTYVLNNAIRYRDPTGHAADAGGVGGIDPLLEGYERGWEDLCSYSEFRDAYYAGVAAATAKMWRRPDPIDIASTMGEALLGDDAPLVQMALLAWLDTDRMWAAAAAQSEQAQAELYMLGAAAAYQPKTFQEPGYTLVPETSFSHNIGPVPANRAGVRYPKVTVPGYGEVPFPSGSIAKTDPSPLRSEYTSVLRRQFRDSWYDKYGWYPSPDQYQIHHIQPLSRGGTNSFENLVPLRTGSEHNSFTNWWKTYP